MKFRMCTLHFWFVIYQRIWMNSATPEYAGSLVGIRILVYVAIWNGCHERFGRYNDWIPATTWYHGCLQLCDSIWHPCVGELCGFSLLLSFSWASKFVVILLYRWLQNVSTPLYWYYLLYSLSREWWQSLWMDLTMDDTLGWSDYKHLLVLVTMFNGTGPTSLEYK